MICARCHRERSRAARRLCWACYQTCYRAGRLLDYPTERTVASWQDYADDLVMLLKTGHSRRDAADRLGMGFKALEKAIQRHKADLDERMARPWWVSERGVA